MKFLILPLSYLNILNPATMLVLSLIACSKPTQSLPKNYSTANAENTSSSVTLNLSIEDGMEYQIVHSTVAQHPAGKKLLTQKRKFKQMAMNCLQRKDTTLRLDGQFFGPYELPNDRYIFALSCASYITGPALRLFMMDSDGVISTTPLDLEVVEPKGRGDYETKFTNQISGFPEFDVKKQTLSFRKYCGKTSGQRNSLSVYQITDGRLKLKEIWLEEQEECSGTPNLKRVF
jgi:hypothetical protein